MKPARANPRRAAWIVLAAGLLIGCRATDAPDPRDDGAISEAGRIAFATHDSLSLVGNSAAALVVLREQASRAEREKRSTAEQAESLLRLGGVEMDLGDLDGAMPHLAHAIELAELAGPQHRLLEAEARNRWGTGAKNQGRYIDAQHSHEAAAELARSVGTAGRSEVAAALAGVGAVMRINPARRDSTALYQAKAIDIMREIEGDSSLKLAGMRVGYALVLAQLDRLPEARRELDAARPVMTANLGADHPGMALAASITGWVDFRSGELVNARHSLEQSLNTTARLRLGAKAGSNRLRYRPKGADVLAAVHLAASRPDEAWNVLDAAQSLLFNEAMVGAGGVGDTPRSITVPPHSREAVQATLDAETAIVGWLDVNLVEETPIESWAYVLRDRGPVRWIRLEPLRRNDRGELHRYRERLEAAIAWPTRIPSTPGLDAAALAAWRERFSRVEPELAGVRHVVVVLSPMFSQVPIDALVDDGGTPIVARYAMSYIHSPSTRVDLARRAAAAPPGSKPSALFIDGDLFARGDAKTSRIGALADFASASHVAPGPGAEGSLRAAWAPTVKPQQQPHLVQFDGHALMDPRLPGSSALVLDGKGEGMRTLDATAGKGGEFVDAPDDGLLSVAEIEAMRLSARLVVLAACQSAGVYTYGGFVGIGDAFLHAGASSVLTSLWAVDERATVELLRRFCHHAYGPDGSAQMPLPEALRLAREEVRTFKAPDGTHPFAHPTYWAPFVLVGESGGAVDR